MPPTHTTRISYQEVDLLKVIQFWVQNHQLDGDAKVTDFNCFVDSTKNVVVLKLHIKEKIK